MVVGPNPAGQGGTIIRAYSGGAAVEAKIYTISGELLWQRRAFGPGFVSFAWDLRTRDGGEASPGLYLIVVEGEGFRERRSLVVLK